MHIRNQRKGTASVLICVLSVPLLFLLAFSVDYGYLLFVRTNLQRVADQAAIASVRELMPNQYGVQDLDAVRAKAREFVELNLGNGFTVLDSEIEIGRYDPDTIYGDLEILNSGTLDTVRITLRRDDMANSSVSLYFARLFGNDDSGVAAISTAVLQRARYLAPGASVFPFALEEKAWNKLAQGKSASIYGDGRIEDENGKNIPGNWGTVDLGPTSNSTHELSTQIMEGLTQNDLDSLNGQNVIPSSEYIDGASTLNLNGDTGLSAGLQHAISDVEGSMKVAPIYKNTTGQGGNLSFEIVGWGTIEIVDSGWNGSKNSYIEVRRSFTYDQNLLPNPDLSDTSNSIEGAFTSPVLVQ